MLRGLDVMIFIANAPYEPLRGRLTKQRGADVSPLASGRHEVSRPACISPLLVMFAIGSVSVCALAQKKPQAPTIHVTTHLVRIGVIVRGRKGPEEDLTKNDFVVLDRGKRREISVFSVQSAASSAPRNSALQSAQPLPPDTFSNLAHSATSRSGNVTIVLLDSLNTLVGWMPMGASGYESTPEWMEDHAFGRAKDHLVAFLKQLGPNDHIAIYGLGDSLRVLCDFTCDRHQLLAVVSKYSAKPQVTSSDAEPGSSNSPVPGTFNSDVDADKRAHAAQVNAARAQKTMAALEAIAAHVADIPGRKNLVWLTANLPFSAQAVSRLLARANVAAYPVDARGLLSRMSRASMPAIARAYDQARPAALVSAEPVGIQTMQDIADETGGLAFVNTNDLTGAIRKAVEDSAITYTLGFYIDGRSLDGKFHKLKVKVRRKGLAIRYPKGYFAFRDVPATEEANRANLIAEVRSPVESSVIPLQVKVEKVDKPSPDSLSVSGTIDLHSFQLTQDGELREGALALVTILQDETGKILEGSDNEEKLRLTSRQYGRYLKLGLSFQQFVRPKPNATTLRVLVEDLRTAKVGSVIVPLSQIQPLKSSAKTHQRTVNR